MQPIVAKIVKMLADERIDRRCAAAMVLGELRVRDAAAVDALGACLAEDNPPLQRYALEALAGARSAKVARLVAPLLDSEDDELRARAAALMASQGEKAAKALATELQSGPPTRRREIVKILAANHGKATFDRLLPLLADGEMGEVVLNALRGELDTMAPAARRQLQQQLLNLLKDRSWLADPASTAHAVRLLGYVRDSKLVAKILPFAADTRPTVVRLAAIAALRRPVRAARSAAKAVSTLLACLDDPDASVARAAIETLRGLEIPATELPRLKRLASGRHAETRAFAIGAIGRSGSGRATALLVERLDSDDPAAREAATAALRQLEGSATVLLKKLADDDLDRPAAERLTGLLRPQADALPPAARRKLVELAADALEQQRPTARALVQLACAADADSCSKTLAQRALKHRRAKRHEQASRLFRQLDDLDLLDDDGRYAALVSGLQTTKSKKELARAARTTNPVLKQAVRLLEQGFPLATKLKRDKSLTPDDLFFVGFNFVESDDEEEKDFGGTLLAHLCSKSPRSKLGRSAKNKLRLVGWE